MILLEEARYESGFKIWCRFSNGQSGTADLSDSLWGPVFEPLKDVSEFRKFQLSPTLHTVVWQNGADLAPEHLYEKAIGKLQLRESA